MTQSTGFSIPAEKQSLFILLFEERLLNVYKIIPVFGPTRKDKTCEVKFQYTGANDRLFPYNSNMAKRFLEQNKEFLGCKGEVKLKSNTSSRVTEVIDLDNETLPSKAYEIRTVDLTEVEPEVIVLDETFSQLNRTISQLDATCSSIDEVEIIDLSTRTLNSSNRNIESFGNDVEILCVKENKKTDISTVSNSKVTTYNGQVKENKRKRKRKNVDNPNELSVSLKSSGERVVICSPNEKSKKSGKRSVSFSIESPKMKKRKLKDVSNNPSSVASPATKPLTDNVIRYYTQVNNHVQNINKRKERIKNKLKNKKEAIKNARQHRKRKSLQKRNINTPNQTNAANITLNPNPHRFDRNGIGSAITDGRNIKKALQNLNHPCQKVFKPGKQRLPEINTFNPNPYNVDREGLRPVVVDGCNIAIGHGKGKFSAKGIKICVDYFANRGHKHVKVFMPVQRKTLFSQELLAELNSKSDIVFTPSQCVNGVWRTSYDDRFIVQYAFEFGGVIVSTDNYRDLLRENPSWRDTIEKRLLMFTWVDDFLMFPVDPLGKRGPTLDQLLRF